ncbi:hypothetical protein [Pseudoxanthomonas broegbernensis]|nr:hypothetical protein [Pseudoxanthomonas broegbernensis]MBB6064023.1 hypothetical protein [Pseudoxanthomonas broegbernensis]
MNQPRRPGEQDPAQKGRTDDQKNQKNPQQAQGQGRGKENQPRNHPRG